jgi:hypothetical protein
MPGLQTTWTYRHSHPRVRTTGISTCRPSFAACGPNAYAVTSTQDAARGIKLTIAACMVTMAIAVVVGAAFTCWHYWRTEQRASSQEIAKEQRIMNYWAQVAASNQYRQQQLRELFVGRHLGTLR